MVGYFYWNIVNKVYKDDNDVGNSVIFDKFYCIVKGIVKLVFFF